jgi:hypothetical protein
MAEARKSLAEASKISEHAGDQVERTDRSRARAVCRLDFAGASNTQ